MFILGPKARSLAPLEAVHDAAARDDHEEADDGREEEVYGYAHDADVQVDVVADRLEERRLGIAVGIENRERLEVIVE